MFKRLMLSLAVLGALFMATAAAADARDRNDDRIPDRWEKRHDLKLKFKQTKRDQDRDGMNNLAEFRARMDPRDDDSDGDGVSDEGENAGKVASFEGGKLTITLFAGGEVSGLVTADTEIGCDDEGDDDEGDDDRKHEDGEHGDDDGDNDDGEHGDNDDGEHGGDDGDKDDDDDRAVSSSRHDDENEDDCDDKCGPEALATGAIVEEAELKLTSDGAVWEEIELR